MYIGERENKNNMMDNIMEYTSRKIDIVDFFCAKSAWNFQNRQKLIFSLSVDLRPSQLSILYLFFNINNKNEQKIHIKGIKSVWKKM